MGLIEVQAKKEIDGEEKNHSMMFDFGEDMEDAAQKFGADVVFTNFRASAKITLQAAIRRLLEKGLTAEQINEKLLSWKPGVALDRTIDPITAFMAKWATMPPEEREKMLDTLANA